MVKIAIIFHSRTGNTEKMAEFVAVGARDAGAEVILKHVKSAEINDISDADGVILGSPTYYGHSSGAMRTFLDKTVGLHGKLVGRIGGAFTSSHNIGGGNETTVLDLLHVMLIHGMIIQGAVEGDHYGPVSVGAPDRRAETQCRELGKRVATLAKKLHG